MDKVFMGLLAAVFAIATSGCVISVNDDGWNDEPDDWQRRQHRNEEAIRHLQPGRTLASVTGELGAPDMTESFMRDGREFRVLFYRTRLMHEDGRTTRDESTPLVFVGNELVGWGESAIEHALP